MKWHPSPRRKNDLLVACMHDGCKIVIFDVCQDGNVKDGQVKKRFEDHKSLAYGADWSFAASEDNETLIGSCSFYDHSMYLWKG